GVAATMYKDDFNGGLYHHHEQWVLDDGSLSENLPANPAGGGQGKRQAEKPWVITLQPYLKGRGICFCPSDTTPRSQYLTTDMNSYNGNITDASMTPPPNSELGIAQANHLALESYVLDSIYT